MIIIMLIIFGVLWCSGGFFLDLNNFFDNIIHERMGVINKKYFLFWKWLFYLVYTYSLLLMAWKIIVFCGGTSFIAGIFVNNFIAEAPDQAISYILEEFNQQTLSSVVENHPDAVIDEILNSQPRAKVVIDEAIFRWTDLVLERINDLINENDWINENED